MKKVSFLLGLFATLFLGSTSLFAQNDTPANKKIDTRSFEEAEEGPIMFKFEPDYLSTIEKRKQEIAQTKRILDTLDISENKRRRLLRDLYKNGLTKRLSKVLVVENQYQ